MSFLNSPRVVENEQFLKIAIEPVNANAIAIFMSFVLLAMAATAFYFWSLNDAILVLLGGLMAGGMFVGAMYLIATNQRNQSLPYINKNQEQLVLNSGTIIPKGDIVCFRQYRCKTKMSNFKLVLTTVATRGSNGDREYAITPIIGEFSEDCVGEAMADFFGRELFQDSSQVFSADELRDLGLS